MKYFTVLLFIFYACNNSEIEEYSKSGDVLNFSNNTFTRNYPESSNTLKLNLKEEDLKEITKKFNLLEIQNIIQDSLYIENSDVNIKGKGYHLKFQSKSLFVESINSDFYKQNIAYLNFSKFIEFLDSIVYNLNEVKELPGAD